MAYFQHAANKSDVTIVLDSEEYKVFLVAMKCVNKMVISQIASGAISDVKAPYQRIAAALKEFELRKLEGI